MNSLYDALRGTKMPSDLHIVDELKRALRTGEVESDLIRDAARRIESLEASNLALSVELKRDRRFRTECSPDKAA